MGVEERVLRTHREGYTLMPSIEERVAYLEGKVEEHSRGLGEIRESVMHMDAKLDTIRVELAARIADLDQKVDRFREELSGRIAELDGRMNSRMDALDQKVDRFRDELVGRIDVLDQRMSRQFIWLVGMQMAVLMAVIGALLR